MLQKLFLTGLVLLVAVLAWARLRRGRMAGGAQAQPGLPPKPVAMVPCQACGAQLDQRLATPSAPGRYLCREHRHLARQLQRGS
ncbi:hypothetical protein EBQ34_12565 [Vandammella animalimorsus]|uniref:Uncharacterized protein n=1 Tax=Vandammella animalimorsus TaxID=2029117 RepID=A0A3M6R4V0_9BURK|nr:hypothetical protein [Vandammella animalimorsus]RMX10252.1 hypothetical protein EBQ34_12565 [Vandammella animalimorsus]